MAAHLEEPGCVRHPDGPAGRDPPVARRTIKQAIADPVLGTLSEVPADVRDHAGGRRRPDAPAARLERDPPPRAASRPASPSSTSSCRWPGADEDAVLAGMNQLWRRNIKKATKAGVEVTGGTRDDLAAFHAVYAETAERDRFTPRPLPYFERMWDAHDGRGARPPRPLPPHHEGDLVAAHHDGARRSARLVLLRCSTTAKRDVRGSNGIQWQMIRDAVGRRSDGLGDARHHRDPRPRRLPRRPDPVQGRHGGGRACLGK